MTWNDLFSCIGTARVSNGARVCTLSRAIGGAYGQPVTSNAIASSNGNYALAIISSNTNANTNMRFITDAASAITFSANVVGYIVMPAGIFFALPPTDTFTIELLNVASLTGNTIKSASAVWSTQSTTEKTITIINNKGEIIDASEDCGIMAGAYVQANIGAAGIGISINRADVTKNGNPVTAGALTLNNGDMLAVTGQESAYSLNIQTAGATVEYNGNPVTSGSNVTVNSNSTLLASRVAPTITPTIGNDMMLKLNGNAITDNVPVTITQSDNTLTAVNTKITPAVTFTFDTGVQVQLNEVDIVSGQSYPLTENGSIIIASAVPEASTLTVNYTGLNSLTLDGTAVSDGQSVAITPGSHQLNATGATAIPTVSINGEGITQFSVNGTDLQPSNLPYTFTPTGGQTNSIYITGSDTASKTLTISGTHIGSMTVNNVEVQLPYTVTVTEPLDISVSGEIYQLDVSSKGGAIITHNNTVIANGETLHTIIDVTKDQFIEIDGTHKLIVTGEDIKTITINGVAVDVSQLPVTINNNAMTASVVIGGYPPSEIHVTGLYIDSASLDGNPVAIGANGSVDLEVEVRDENHFLTIAGSQPRKYNLTFDDNGTTNISVDGQEMANGQVLPINDSKFISALPTPVPLNFDADNMSIIKVDGVPYTGDFSVDVSRETYVQVNSSSCTLTIDYGDNSYQISVPQRMVTLTAPHRDGWIFDTWTSNDIGIVNPRMVQCNIDLTGKTSAHLVANYQRYITCDKPNHWN